MAIGAHELLLIVRGQNQASAMLGRVGRDIRRLQAQSSLQMQRAQIANRLARNQMQQMQQLVRMEEVLASDGRVRLQHNQAVARNQLQQLNIQNRIQNLEIRRAAVDRARISIEVQRLRLLKQEAGLEAKLAAIEEKRQGILASGRKFNVQMMRNAGAAEALNVRNLNLQAQLLERQLALRKANRAYEKEYMGAVAAGGPDPTGRIAGSPAAIRKQIADLRVQATQAALAGIPGQQKLLREQSLVIQDQVAAAARSLETLKIAEADVAREATILAERHAMLDASMRGVAARGQAATLTERELNEQLKITELQVAINTARWEQQKTAVTQAAAAYGVLIDEEKVLNAQLAETNAQLALMSSERLATLGRTVSHVGRILQATGLIGAAALGAMAVSAAHFNVEAVRAATQVGAIGSNAGTVVANAGRIEKAITGIMQVVPGTSQDLTDSLYNIYSSIDSTFGQGTKLLKLFGQVWVAGGMVGNINEVADALITLGNNWNISAGDMASWNKLAASTLATVRFGRLSVEQYTTTMNQLAPAFRGAGQSIEQMNGALAFLTRLLPSQRVTAAGIARMMELIGRFAARPKTGFEDLAKQIQDAKGNLLPLDRVLDIFIKRFPKLLTSGVFRENFFKMITGLEGTVQARRAFKGFIQQFDLYRSILAKTTGDQKEFTRSLKAFQQTPGYKWQLFLSQMHALGLELGAVVLPLLLKAITPLQNLAKWWNNLSETQRRNYGQWLAFVAVGTLVVGTISSVAGGLTSLFVSLSRFIKPATEAASATKALGSEAGFANTRLVRIFGTVGLLIAAFPILQHVTHDTAKTIEILATGLSVMVAARTVTGLRNVNGGLITMKGAMGGLRTATLLEIIAIGQLSSEVEKLIRKIPGWDKAFKALGAKIADITGHGPKNVSATQLSNEAELFRNQMHIVANAVQASFAQGLRPDTIRSLMYAHFPFMDPDRIHDFTEKAIAAYLAEQKAWRQAMKATGYAAREGVVPAGSTANITKAMYTMKMFSRDLTKAYQLQQNLQKAPNLAAAEVAWLKYSKFVAAVTKHMTTDQKKMWDDLLSMMGQFGADAKKVSDTQALGILRNIDRLTRIAQKAPTIANWDAVIAAQKNADKVLTQDQQNMGQNIIQSEKSLQQERLQAAKDAAAKLKKIRDKERDDNKRRFEQEKQQQQQAQQSVKSLVSNVMGIYQNALQTYQGQLGTLFEGPFMQSAVMQNRQQFGFAARPQDLLKDMQESVGHFRRFQNTVGRLRRRGAPEELISQIQQLGPAAQGQLDDLLKLSSPDLQKYFKIFQTGQNLAQAAAQRDLNAQLEKWKKFGKNVALAIALGIRSENVALENSMKEMLRGMFPGLFKKAETKPVQTRYFGSEAAAEAYAGRMNKQATIHHENVTYNVYAAPGEGWEVGLRRAHFKHKNRKK
ncbi:MAG TPA: phage tail tape measure protein [Nitrososphaera sp.]